MSAVGAWALALGSVLGIGLWSIVSILPRLSAPSLSDRIAPYLLDVSDGARRHAERRNSDPLPILGSLFTPFVRRLAAFVGALVSSNQSVRRKLDQSGSSMSVMRFRYEQLLWGVVGAAVGVPLSILVAGSQISGLVVMLVPVICAAGGVIGRDFVLQRDARARAARMTDELPTVLEFLSLTLSAGEGIFDSISRLARRGSGELSTEFRIAVHDVSLGITLAGALAACASRAQVSGLTRAIEQLTATLERGSPLGEVLRSQAQDARDDAKRALLESAGKKEVAMLIPLVLFILPLSVIFAIFPGIFVLQSGF